jgi:hypothetical protein
MVLIPMFQQNSYAEKLISKVMIFGRWLGLEVEPLSKSFQSNSLHLPSHEETGGTMYEQEIQPSPDTKSTGAFILDFPYFRTSGNFCCL